MLDSHIWLVCFCRSLDNCGRLFGQSDALLHSIRDELVKNDLQGVAVLYDRAETSPRGPASESDASDSPPTEDVQLENTAIFYIGGESLGLTNLLMTNSGRDVRGQTLASMFY